MTADCVGGVWTYALDLARALRAHGVDVVLATMGAPLSEDQRRESEAAGLAALHESRFRLEWMDEAWDDVEQAGEWLLELADHEAADVVHLSSYAHGRLSWGRPVVLVAHSDVCSWWRAVHGGEPPDAWLPYRQAVAAGLRAAAAVAAPTRAVLGDLQREYGFAGGLVIHNASSAPEPPAGPREPFVLAAGRLWDQAKNLGSLDQAARGLSWPVVVAGPLGRSAPENVRATGPLARDQLAALGARASIFAAPARYEPFGLAALEAARAGCALVLGDIASLREVWDDAALYVDPSDPAALRGALEELSEQPARREEMAARARRRAARFSVQRMARAYSGLYARVRERTEAVA
jgi:glycosyltransferase involved in cell wall biosynthesis